MMKLLLSVLLSALGTFLLSGHVLAAPVVPLAFEESPCSNDRTLENTMCQMGRRRLKVQQAHRTEGRSLSVLRKRGQDARSHLVPRSQQKPMRVDLRPASEREKEVQRKRRAVLKERGEGMQKPSNTLLIRARAKSGTRGEAISPVCSRRHGLELIKCLTELGIEISPKTADEATLKLYEEQRKVEGG